MNKIIFILLCNLFLTGNNTYTQSKFLPQTGTFGKGLKHSLEFFGVSKRVLQESSEELKKISFDLLQIVDEKYLPQGTTQEEFANGMEVTKQFIPNKLYANLKDQISKGSVYVYIYFDDDESVKFIEDLASNVTDLDYQNKMLTAWIEVERLPKIASFKGVKQIRSVSRPVLNKGSVTTQGDGVHRTSDVRTLFTKDGTGVKIGVISDGVQNRSSAQASGDLPLDGNGLTVLSTGTGNEGTAMLEIIHDMVPGASLYFQTCGTNTTQFNTAIDNLVAAGCRIICDDISWITQPFFEDGTVASHLKNVLSANDILYVSAAGNNGYSHYQGMYYPISVSNAQHHFGEGSTAQGYYLYLNLPPSTNVRIVLQWDDKFGASANDYDLYLYRYSNSSVVASSLDVQNGNDDPLEIINYTSQAGVTSDYAIIVNKYSGTAKKLEVFVYPSGSGAVYTNNIKPEDAVFGHAAVNSAITVGAVNQSTPTTIESFSSLGPSTISYPTSELRSKPNIVGVDFVNVTGAGGFPSLFGGTSAAVPHVVSVLAQVWSHDLTQSANEVKQLLYDWAVDLGAAGYDNVYGYGRADALNIFNGALPVELSAFSASTNGSQVELNWRTETETQNYGFEVERKDGSLLSSNANVDYAGFEKIGFVPGNGNSNSPKEYAFIDYPAKSGRYFYRLKQMDSDGGINYSKVIGIILEVPHKYELSQNYPNPFNPVTTINFSLPASEYVKLRIYNLLGEELETLVNEYKEAGSYNINFDADNLESGVYL